MKSISRAALSIFLLICTACNLPGAAGSNSGATGSQATQTPTVTPTPAPLQRIDQGDQAIINGNNDLAITQFQTALSDSSDPETRSRAQFEIGRIQYMRADDAACENTFLQFPQQYPQSSKLAQAYFLLGACEDHLKKYKEAADAYGQYLSRAPDLLAGYVQQLRGDALFNAGDNQNAITAYQAAINSGYFGDTGYLQISIGKAFTAMGDNNNAVKAYLLAYDVTNNTYAKSQANLLAGQGYIAMGLPDQAYARFQDSVNKYPKPYDSYSALVALVNDNQPVDDLSRGLVDYYAGQYAVAIQAFDRYMNANPKHDATANYFKAQSLIANNQVKDTLVELNTIIKDHPGQQYWTDAWSQKAELLWSEENDFTGAAQTLLDFVALYPKAPEAPGYLFRAARIYEIGNQLTNAAGTWERVMNEYPSDSNGYTALFLAGITYYRLANYNQALVTFQRNLVLATTPGEKAMADFWIGKTQMAMKNNQAAQQTWTLTAQLDPTGYYSERARELLNNESILNPTAQYDLGYNLDQERPEAEAWLRKTFNIPADTNLSDLGDLSKNQHFQRGMAFWELMQTTAARSEFESAYQDIYTDPVNTYRFVNQMLNLGYYRQAIIASRQILDLANLDDAGTLRAPVYFNHIRFGVYFRETVVPLAKTKGIHPFLILSIIRQESMFDSSIVSSAGAVGLMQLLPAVGEQVAGQINWPVNFTTTDLYNPAINIRLGTEYLTNQSNVFDNNLYAALAAYNGGPGNASAWLALASNDPDLLLETIRYQETRDYIRQIVEFANIYRLVYERKN
jgi:soluble lytic murein transglycosylase